MFAKFSSVIECSIVSVHSIIINLDMENLWLDVICSDEMPKEIHIGQRLSTNAINLSLELRHNLRHKNVTSYRLEP